MKTLKETPFVFGRIAQGIDFTDREAEAKRLKQNLGSGVNSILISPRRWGKSSLVNAVSVSMQKNKAVRFCFIDLFNVRTEHEFYELLVKELIRVSSGKWEERVEGARKFFKKIVPRFSVGLDPSSEFSVSIEWNEIRKAPEEILNLPEVLSKTKKFRLVLCIDEFQNISFFDDPLAFQKKLRSHWQHHQQATYCLYGSKRHMLMELFSGPDMPFYKFGDTIFLEKIPEAYWVDYIVKRFADTGKVISKEHAASIALIMENHPYFVQQLAQAVWFRSSKHCGPEIILQSVDALLMQHGILFQREVDQLTNPQLNFLKAMCAGVKQFSARETLLEYKLGTSANVNRIKTALENKEIIDTLGQGIEFLDPLFKLWLKKVFFKTT
jgi:hypothetical protein